MTLRKGPEGRNSTRSAAWFVCVHLPDADMVSIACAWHMWHCEHTAAVHAHGWHDTTCGEHPLQCLLAQQIMMTWMFRVQKALPLVAEVPDRKQKPLIPALTGITKQPRIIAAEPPVRPMRASLAEAGQLAVHTINLHDL